MNFSELIRKREIIKLFYGELASKITKKIPDDDDGFLVCCYKWHNFLDAHISGIVRNHVNFKINDNFKTLMRVSFKVIKHDLVPLSSYKRLEVTESILKELE